MIDFNTVKYTF